MNFLKIMKQLLHNPYITLFARVLIGCVFVIAAVGKVADPAKFANEIIKYNLLPDASVNIMALVLPWIELCCGIFILAGVKLRANSALVGLMLIVFTSAVLISMARGLDINCGCFGDAKKEKVGWPKVSENLALILLSGYIFTSRAAKFNLDGSIPDQTAKTS